MRDQRIKSWKTVRLHTMYECLRSNKNCLSRTINCHVYQTEESRPIFPGYTQTQDYSDVFPDVIPHYFGGITLDSEWVYLCTCALVCLVEKYHTALIVVLFIISFKSCNFHSRVLFKNNHFNFPWTFCHMFWILQTKFELFHYTMLQWSVSLKIIMTLVLTYVAIFFNIRKHFWVECLCWDLCLL